MAELEEWRVFIRDFSDLALVRMAKELRQYPEDKPYLDEVLRELGDRDRGSVTMRHARTKRNPSRKRQHERKRHCS